MTKIKKLIDSPATTSDHENGEAGVPRRKPRVRSKKPTMDSTAMSGSATPNVTPPNTTASQEQNMPEVKKSVKKNPRVSKALLAQPPATGTPTVDQPKTVAPQDIEVSTNPSLPDKKLASPQNTAQHNPAPRKAPLQNTPKKQRTPTQGGTSQRSASNPPPSKSTSHQKEQPNKVASPSRAQVSQTDTVRLRQGFELKAVYQTIFEFALTYHTPLNTVGIAKELGIDPKSLPGLQTFLDGMAERKMIRVTNKMVWVPTTDQPLQEIPLTIVRDGSGSFWGDNDIQIKIPAAQLLGAWHGDTVLVQLVGAPRSNVQDATVVQIVQRKHVRVVGKTIFENGVWLVAPNDVRLQKDIVISPISNAIKINRIVVVALDHYGSLSESATGHIVEELGNAGDPGMEIEIAVRKFDVPHEFSEKTLADVAKLPSEVTDSEKKGRIDLRDIDLVTIDGEDARDFDDAVYCEPIYDNKKIVSYRLIVAIADVSHYVFDGSAVNYDALGRATSVYFPRRVIPMLPEKLSNGLCSLNPHLDRLCMVSDMVIDLDGEIQAYQFYPAVMHSSARLTYDQVWQFLNEGSGVIVEKYANLSHALINLYELYKILLASRKIRGAMEFETVETQIVSDDEGKILDILAKSRNDAHRVIEECMLAANVSAADFINQSGKSSLFRVHQGPSPERLENLRAHLKLAGLKLEGGERPTPKDYAQLMALINEREDKMVLQTLVLRSMQQAVYTPDNMGHFGLAYEAYAHFTSPIRRYPDLLVHRTIKAILNHQSYLPLTQGIALLKDSRKKPKGVAQMVANAKDGLPAASQKNKSVEKNESVLLWEQLGEHSSMCERRADEASKDVVTWLKCEYMKAYLGDVLPGHISGVTAFGAFVTLDDMYVDGLIHISELGRGYFEYDETTQSLYGRNSGQRFKIGDALNVKIAGVDSNLRRIDFVMDGLGANNSSNAKRNRSGSPSGSGSDSKDKALRTAPKSGSKAYSTNESDANKPKSSKQRSRRK